MCFVNQSIAIPKNLPKGLLKMIDDLMELKANGDVANFDCLLEAFESEIKSYHIVGKVSRRDALQLMSRFGI